MKAKKLGEFLLTSYAKEAIVEYEPNFFRRPSSKAVALGILRAGKTVYLGEKKIKAVAPGVIDEVSYYPEARE